MVKEIKLNHGKSVLVDAEDYDFLMNWKWQYLSRYAVTTMTVDGKRKMVLMHRLLNNTPEGMATDHINRNRLDNRRINLRTVSYSQNAYNTSMMGNNTSGYIGVSWRKSSSNWVANIGAENSIVHLGYFDSKHHAAIAYNEAAKILHGEFANLNEISKDLYEKYPVCEKSIKKRVQKKRTRFNNTSGYRGVSWHKRDLKWTAQIKDGKRNKSLGYFDCKHKAALAYNKAATKLHGDEAHLNHIDSEVLDGVL